MNGIRDAVRFCGRADLLTLFIVGMLLLSSCVTTGGEQQQTGPSVQGDRSPQVFQSSRYVVALPVETTSAEALAEQYLGSRNRGWVIEECNGGSVFHAGDVVVIPMREENPGGLERNGYQTIPVLSYHRFASACTDALCISEDEFERQMALLAEQGYRSITLDDLHEFLYYRRGLPAKAVVITIDDGYSSTYELAYPILRKHGFTAALFVYTDFIGVGSKALTWDQIREMKSNGFEVGSHTVTHCDLTKPLKGESDQAYQDRLREELLKSKQVIDAELGQDTMALAFPYGNVTPGILQLSQSLGYRLGFTVRPGSNPFFADPLNLRRNPVLWKGGIPFEDCLKTFETESLVHASSRPHIEQAGSTGLHGKGEP